MGDSRSPRAANFPTAPPMGENTSDFKVLREQRELAAGREDRTLTVQVETRSIDA